VRLGGTRSAGVRTGSDADVPHAGTAGYN
jgi:hypothetical protein